MYDRYRGETGTGSSARPEERMEQVRGSTESKLTEDGMEKARQEKARSGDGKASGEGKAGVG